MAVNRRSLSTFVERAGRSIPDPVLIFMAFYPLAYILTVFMSGYTFETPGAGGEMVTHQIFGMHQAVHMQWIFDNALLANWFAFGNGVLGVILIVIMAVGVTENSGLFGAMIKRTGAYIPQKWLPFMRQYKPEMGFGDMLIIMVPYSLAFLVVWSLLLVGFFAFGIPLGV